MIRHPHRKMFYPIGIISLALFPILGLQKLAEEYTIRTARPHCIELNFAPSKIAARYKEFGVENIKKMRRYKTFKLTKDSSINHSILNNARLLLNKIKKDKDTYHGVHIVFKNTTRYGDFIKAVNYCFEKFPATFAPCDNNIWAMYDKVDTSNYPREKLDEMRRKGQL